MRHTVADLRGALRALVRTPGFAVAAILSIAIGIGANTAIFSVASALLLRPLPYRDADRLVILWNRSPGLGIAEDWFSTAQYFDIVRAHGGFETVAIAIGAQLQSDRRRRAGADRHDPGLVESVADARRARRSSAGCSRRRMIAGRSGTAMLGARHLDAPLRRRPASRPRPDAQRSALRSGRRAARRRSRCRAK